MSRYSIEVDCGGEECTSYEPRFASYDTISGEGETLEELLETACVWITDQDGGELGDQEADADWMQAALLRAFVAKYCDPKSDYYDPPGHPGLSDAQQALRDLKAAQQGGLRGLNEED